MKSHPNLDRQKGFTLIELIIVIVILGILSAAALPRFIDLTTDARVSALEGMAGSLRSAVAMAHGEAIVKEQNGPTGSITVEGQTISLVFGYPTAASVMDLISDTSGFTETAGTGTTEIDNGASVADTCKIIYGQPTANNEAPNITLIVSDCS